MNDHHKYCSGGFSPDDIVISGISGRFPMCDTVGEFGEALLTKKNLLIPNNDRYEKGASNLPFSSSGTINNLDKFDNVFFGISTAVTKDIDVMQRFIAEVSYEAIADSGYDPQDLNGANIGIYTAIVNQDGRELKMSEKEAKKSYAFGFLRTMLPSRCAYSFNFHGPAYTIDSACSSSLVALWSAFNDIRDGRVDGAVVNASQLCLNPVLTYEYLKSGIASETCTSCPFDAKANGLVRSEAVTAVFLQKASVARRAYATILSIKHRGSGYVPDGIYVPSEEQETELFLDILKDSGLEPNDVMFIEAHGTGTAVGDPIEVKAIEKAFCTNPRSKPLYIGSVKSNVGHSEAASGLTGTIKVILACETGMISPNCNYESPNTDCEALVNGSIEVLSEPIPLLSPYVPVNSFGFGGSLLTAMLKQNPIEISNTPRTSNLPRLVLYPATTEDAVQTVFNYIQKNPGLNEEFFALLNKLSFTSIMKKPFRGYSLTGNQGSTHQIQNCQSDKKRQVWFVMTGMGCQWPGMGLEMMKLDTFAESMKNSATVLKPLGIDLFEVLKKESQQLLTNRRVTPAFVAIAAIQIALIDVLRSLEIEPDGLLGHSLGELICAYADGCCTAEQTLLSAYWRGASVEATAQAEGAMAATGLTWEEAVKRCPEGVFPACHNASDSVTISGLKEPVEQFVAELLKENIFARVVNVYGFAFHCQHIWPAADILRKNLSQVFINPRPRTERWISTSYPEEEWLKEDCRMAGPEYFVHNLMSTVRFNEMLPKIPSDAITIEIGPHFLLQSILKRSIGPSASYFGLMKRNDDNNIEFFMDTLGKLYLEGVNPRIENIYPPVKFPVPRGTPIISDLIKWDHSLSHNVDVWKPDAGPFIGRFYLDKKHCYLLDHFIDGKSLFPATGYVYLAWKALADQLQKDKEEVNIVIQDFKIHRATILNPSVSATTFFSVHISDKTGAFEVSEGKSLVASGKIYEIHDVVFTEPDPTLCKDENSTFVSGDEIYNELKICGYEYGPAFRNLMEANIDGTRGFVEWNNWISFLDALFLFYMFYSENSDFVLPTGALNFKIYPNILKGCIEECQRLKLPGLPVDFYKNSKICRTAGIEITSLEVDSTSQHVRLDDCILEEYKFVPYSHKYEAAESEKELKIYMEACNRLINKLETQLGVDLDIGKFHVERNHGIDFESYINDFPYKQSLLATLKHLSNLENGPDAIQRREIFSIFVDSIGKDLTNTALVNEYYIRLMFDILLENSFRKLNVLEINNGFSIVLPKVVEVVEKYSMVKIRNKTLACIEEDVDKDFINECNIQLLSPDKLTAAVQDKSQSVVISSFLTGTNQEAKELISLLTSKIEDKGFVLLFHKNTLLPLEKLIATLLNETIEVVPDNSLEKIFDEEQLTIVSKISDSFGGNLYLLRHNVPVEPGIVINMKKNANWFDDLKSSVVESSESIWLLAENCPNSGIIGMINCLRHEPDGDKLRCIFLPEREHGIPPFNFTDPFFKKLLKTDLVMNVYKDGAWGSYRHSRIDKEPKNVEVDGSYVNITKYGDLSSLKWMESAVKYLDASDLKMCHIYYASLNFKDVMLATGKISKMTAKAAVGIDNCVLGLEFCGRTSDGKRVMSVCISRGIATVNMVRSCFLIDIPDHWSLEEAATVPVVYTTCYYALIARGHLKPGESILIHSGTGGIGLAAINIALSMNCEIFTTVGTEEKRQYLMKMYPSIKSENIGCSRNTTFENMIMNITKGRGVDMVLNSLADEKFRASIRCVAKHGRFIEIGKYDLAMDHAIGLKFFLKNVAFIGVFLDQLFDDSEFANETLQNVIGLIKEGIRTGVVKPLTRTVFQRDEVEKAFRYMAGGTHIGKVLIKIRDEETDKFAIPKLLRIPAEPVTYFYSTKMYIVVGGLGGFGIEVSKWLLSRGAKNLVLTSRYGARTPYHHLCLRRWKNSGFNVVISTRNVSIKDEAAKLLKEVSNTAPVGGIFNSAVVLHDAFLENMDLDKFKAVCAPKADATRHLDTLSRVFCPELDHFVCFSSISCGRGNAGQMNYGYANSVMERICEQRHADGLPGLAIQWGIIGDVGVVHRHMGDDAMIAGVGAQRVKSCLDIVDKTCQLGKPVVSSYVIKDPSRKKGDQGDILEQLARIFGLKDASEFSTMRSFGEIGVDSMSGVEIKQLLETSLDTTFTVKEIQELKIEDVKALLENKDAQKSKPSTALVSTLCINLPKAFVHTESVVPLNTVKTGVPVFILDLDCSDPKCLQALGDALNQPAFALLWINEMPISNIESMASWYLEKIRTVNEHSAHLVAHSSASILAFEMLIQDQKSTGNILSLTILNGCSSLTKAASMEQTTKLTETDILQEFVKNYIPGTGNILKEKLAKASNNDNRIRIVVDLFSNSSSEAVNKAELSELIAAHIKKVQVLQEYSLRKKISKDLLVVEDSSNLLANDIAEVKRLLTEICSGKILIHRIPGIASFSEESVKMFKDCFSSVL